MKNPATVDSRVSIPGGLGRNRTTDTRIFNPRSTTELHSFQSMAPGSFAQNRQAKSIGITVSGEPEGITGNATAGWMVDGAADPPSGWENLPQCPLMFVR